MKPASLQGRMAAALFGMSIAALASAGASPVDIAAHASQIAAGRWSARQAAAHYLRRIHRLNTAGPALHAIIETNPDALRIAARLDAAPGPHGPLHGVPIALKDNIDTADRMSTSAGSWALMDTRPAHDAFIVGKLRAAGALILAKTNLSEWANYRSTRSSSGWSARGGQTRNPYDRDRNACGSSSGSGAAVAADLVLVAVGTETDGSIVCPSSVNGLVGIKPTVGLVSRSGIIPISASQDTAGPMARSVADAARLLSVMAGYDPGDPATAVMRDRPTLDYAQFLDPHALRGARIGVLRRYAGFHESVDALFDQALAAMRAQGAIIVDPVDFVLADAVTADEGTVMSYEFKDGINRYLAGRSSGPRTLAELIAFNQRDSAREMPYFLQELFLQAESRGPLTDAAYVDARERSRKAAGVNGIDAALAAQHLDALVAPTSGPAWTTDLINGDRFIGGNISAPPAIAGYPHVTVPMGQVHGLPVGISLVGTAFSEARLIALAYAYESATHARRPPALASGR